MTIRMRRFVLAGIAGLCLLFPAAGFAAPTVEELLQRLNDLSDVIQKQQQEIEKLRQELDQQKRCMDAAEEIRKQEIDKAVKAEVKEQEKTWSDYVPKWVKTTKLSGDLRLRYEGLYHRDKQLADGTTADLVTRDRYRLRARLFVDSRLSDEVSTHFMICTNQDSNEEATTTNQTFADDFNDKGIYLHRAYATYKPGWLTGSELTAGKFPITLLHTDIMWDPDVNLEGIYERYQYKGWKAFHPYIHLAQTAVHEVNSESDDPYLFINQAGFEWKIGPVRWTLAGSYYDWTNLENTRYLHSAQYKGGGGNTFINQGGTLQYKYDYDLVQGITLVGFDLGAVPARVVFDYIVNLADEVPGDQDTAYYAGFDLGKRKKKGDWSFSYKYARIEKDALIGSLNDQDFYGANRKGHKARFDYLLIDSVQFGTAYFYTDPIELWDPSSPTFNNNDQLRGHEDRLQVDFIFKF